MYIGGGEGGGEGSATLSPDRPIVPEMELLSKNVGLKLEFVAKSTRTLGYIAFVYIVCLTTSCTIDERFSFFVPFFLHIFHNFFLFFYKIRLEFSSDTNPQSHKGFWKFDHHLAVTIKYLSHLLTNQTRFS